MARGRSGGYAARYRWALAEDSGVTGRSPCDGSAYAFRNRAGNRIKLLIWDGTGVWLCVRRLHRGRFTWPQSNESICTLSEAEWRWLTAGVDWRRLQAKAPEEWQV